MTKTFLTHEDIMDMTAYAEVRQKHRAQIMEKKKSRRLHCGPHATFYFENFDTMWHQVHEMLFIEKGGAEQIVDELHAYNPLIPNGHELVATLMFEIDNSEVRTQFLDGLGGIEKNIFFDLGSTVVNGVPEADIDRTNAEGKASSVQFLHFPFMSDQIATFKSQDARIMLHIEHEKYAHAVVLTNAVREVLAMDFA